MARLIVVAFIVVIGVWQMPGPLFAFRFKGIVGFGFSIKAGAIGWFGVCPLDVNTFAEISKIAGFELFA
ncbi:hypothetical protein D5275_05545 [Adlercreutzia muris]|nr:hypothetical protein [Adlercreutzia muris]